MTISDVHGGGGWALNEVLTSAQMNAIRTELLKCIDGANGGTYALNDPLVFDGDEVRFDAVLRMRTGSDLFIDAGSNFECNAAAEFNDNVDFDDQVDFNSTVDFHGFVQFRTTAEVEFQDLEATTVDNLQHTYRVPLVPGTPSFIGTPREPTWALDQTLVGQWRNRNASTNSRLYFSLPVMAGDSIVAINVTLQGGNTAGHGGVDPDNKVRVRLLESAAGSGAVTEIFSVTDGATGAAYDASHTMILDALSTIVLPITAADRYYVLEIRSEFGGTAAADENLIERVTATITRRQLVSTNIFGS